MPSRRITIRGRFASSLSFIGRTPLTNALLPEDGFPLRNRLMELYDVLFLNPSMGIFAPGHCGLRRHVLLGVEKVQESGRRAMNKAI